MIEIQGKFLEKRLVTKPNSSEYYGPSDFYIGAALEFYRHPFVITGADVYGNLELLTSLFWCF